MSTLPKSNEKIKEKCIHYLKEGFFSFIWLAILLVIIDVITKVLAMQYLGNGSVEIIPHLLKFTLIFNKGAAWGFLGGELVGRIILVIISWVAMIAISAYFIVKYKTLNKLMKAILMVILAGDVGNLIDRTFYFNRGVVDFLDITDFIPGFGVFNFADSCLVVGILMLCVYFIVLWIKELVKEGKANRIKENNKDDEK